jgi:hypothetical protein
MTTINWQQPYVNTFKHFTIASDKNVVKHGDITTIMVNKYSIICLYIAFIINLRTDSKLSFNFAFKSEGLSN